MFSRASFYSTLFRALTCQELYLPRFTRRGAETCEVIANRQPSPLRCGVNSRGCQLDELARMLRRWLSFRRKLSWARGQMNNLMLLLQIRGWKHFVTSWLGLEKKPDSWSKPLIKYPPCALRIKPAERKSLQADLLNQKEPVYGRKAPRCDLCQEAFWWTDMGKGSPPQISGWETYVWFHGTTLSRRLMLEIRFPKGRIEREMLSW